MIDPARATITNNRTALVLYAVMMVLGVHTFLTIGRLEYPEFTIRNAQVITSYPGRTTLQVEKEITEPLEQSLRQMAEVKEIKSTSKPGISILSVEVQDAYFDLEPIWQDMRNRISATELPEGSRPPNVNDDFGDVFPYVYALRSDGFTPREVLDFAEEIRDELLAIDGVAKVEFHGDQEERVYLEYSSSQLATYGISLTEIAQQLGSQNAVATSGDVAVGSERLRLVTLGEFESIEELENYRLRASNQVSSLRVADLFEVRRDYIDPPQSIARFNGERVLCIAISMVKGGVVTEIGERIEASLAATKARLPWGLDIEAMFYQPEYVGASVRNFLVNLGQAFFFVVLVMLAFAGWRISIIVGVLVPSATLICFAFMPTFGIELEMMSIAALIIALGLLVDNAVVVSEQILVRFGEGEDRLSAVSKSVQGLMIPLLAASGTTIAAFSPVALAAGSTSEFTYSLFAVVSLTLVASWVLSLTIIPLLCFYFLRPLERDTFVGRALNRIYAPYEKVLRLVLRLRWVYPITILLLTITAGWAFRFVPNIFFPPNERGQFNVDFGLPLGTDIVETENGVNTLERWLLDEKGAEIRSISAWVGNGGPRWYLALSPEAANPNYAFLTVLTTFEDPPSVHALIADLRNFAAATFPDTRVTATALENGPPVGDPVQIRLYGNHLETLYGLRDQIVERVESVSGMTDVRDDWGAWVKQITIDPDPIRAPRLGLSTETIAGALNAQFSGLPATDYREDDKAIPVLFRSREDFRRHPDRLPDLPIFVPAGGVVPLGDIATIRTDFQPGSILREDTLRVMTVKGRVTGRFASEALADIKPALAELTSSSEWPAAYHIEYGGEQEESGESQANIGGAMPISLSILALILISQFNSIRRFTVVMLTIPPMLIGVVPGLLLTGSSFGFMTLLGLIALLGIIVNNAILLIDETDTQLGQSLPLTEAIVTAARSRLRPIIMTTMTTIIGLLPLALGGGGMWSSMAYAMMFGLGFATLLTLLLCPALFFLFFRRTYPEPT